MTIIAQHLLPRRVFDTLRAETRAALGQKESGSSRQGESGPGPVQLTDATFAAKTARGVWLVEFFAPWCGHCQALERESVTRESIRGDRNCCCSDVAAVGATGARRCGHVRRRPGRSRALSSAPPPSNCVVPVFVRQIAALDATAHTTTAQQHDIKGFPTIKLFVDGRFEDDYHGGRDLRSLLDYVKVRQKPASPR